MGELTIYLSLQRHSDCIFIVKAPVNFCQNGVGFNVCPRVELAFLALLVHRVQTPTLATCKMILWGLVLELILLRARL